jgi:hypothetical protein
LEGNVAENEKCESLNALLRGLLHEKNPLSENYLHRYLASDCVVLSNWLRIVSSLKEIRIDELYLKAVLVRL